MDKRYQVFVSSTYTDLKDARRRVIEILLESDCIPIGMELFPATDEDSWKYIASVIEECDYYVLVMGGRYGSTDEKGLGFTEREYDYAVEKKVPILAFTHGNTGELSANVSELTPDGQAKLKAFRKKVQANQLVKHWTSVEDLAGKVAVSINQAKRRIPRIGWVRANEVAPAEVYQELERLRRENTAASNKSLIDTSRLCQGNDEFVIPYQLAVGLKEMHQGSPRYFYEDGQLTCTWDKLFELIAPELLIPKSESNVRHYIDRSLKTFVPPAETMRLYDDPNNPNHKGSVILRFDMLTIMFQYEALGLVSRVEVLDNNAGTLWVLTPQGQQKLISLRVAYRKA